MNDGSEFGGLKEFADKLNAAPPAPAAAPAAPAAAPPEPTPAPAAEPAAPASEAKQDAPAAPPAAPSGPRKFKVPGKVAGEAKEWEVSEDDFDETKSPDGFKRLQQTFQKAEDYDRPGGALDQRAAKLAAENHAKYMLEQGFWVRDAAGRIVEAPQVTAYRAWRQQQGAQSVAPQAPAPPGAQQATPQAPQTDEQRRLSELETRYNSDDKAKHLTRAEYDEMIELRAVTKIERRQAEREAKRLADEQAQRAQQSAATAEQQAANERATRNQAEIDNTVKSLETKLKNPLTGQVDPVYVDAARSHMTRVLLETRDWDKARAAAREFAERHEANMRTFVEKIPRAAAAPPLPPSHRGAQSGAGEKQAEEVAFNPERPFEDGGLARWAKRAG